MYLLYYTCSKLQEELVFALYLVIITTIVFSENREMLKELLSAKV